jgi:cytochrome c-type biogenesis protein CcmH/NrfG
VEYERALQLNPELVSARTNLGALSFKQGRFAEAVEHFEAVLRLEPGRVDAKAALEAARRAASRER